MKKNMKLIILLSCVVMLVIGLYAGKALHSYFPQQKENLQQQGGYTIGISYQNVKSEYIQNLRAAIREEAKQFNVSIIEKDGQGKVENQVTQVEGFISQKVDAIILNPFDKDGTVAAVEKANEAKIPIIVLNAQVENLDKATAYVGSDDIVAGRLETELMVKHLGGKGNVVILHIQSGNSAEISRTEGIKEVLSDYPDIHILAEQTANGNREYGKYLMEKWLTKFPEIDGLISQNDAMALGAYEAIKAVGREKEILIVGIDAIPEALEAVRREELLGTVFQDAETQGSMAIQVALQAAAGHKVNHMNDIPFQLITKQ